MRFSTSLFFSLSTLLVATTAQTAGTNHVENVECLAFPAPILPRGGNQTLPLPAVNGLAEALANNSFTPALPTEGIRLKPGQATRVQWGKSPQDGYQVCVQNWYFFKTITVPLDAISETVVQIRDTCCKPEAIFPGRGRKGDCQDAVSTLKLADGSEIKIVGQDFDDNCCGQWGCNS